ncbi:hypothetical protein DEF23_16880 [Marinitenerispora sediminis]|uniref:Uncharacterized protein n=1 Tax=Marinitenerispora sediminis TaxID=1931232 RepID=A0A368T0G9_9ACTN|nr:hypothetical protein DEF28_16550 [Marinitenerispora sediminis]RCV52487.1 hypothetical protein DEF24_21920 [Marinitenerispora sediminis]RCV53838.1 hypothetical protein DEF23_16880 [Marinitenerispora sediminis]
MVTRNLCTGAYLNRDFRNMIIRKVHNDPYHRVAPSYGFDLVPVMRSAWVALLLEVALHTTIAASVALPALLDRPTAALLVTCLFVLLWLMGHVPRILIEMARLNAELTEEEWREPRKRATQRWTNRHGRLRVLRRQLQAALPTTLAIALVTVALGNSSDEDLALALMTLTSAGLVAAALGAVRHHRLSHVRRALVLRPGRLTPREDVVASQQSHTYVVYRRPEHKDEEDDDPLRAGIYGKESPFVGSGKLIHYWNPPMTVQMLRPRTGDTDATLSQLEYSTPPFEAHELVHHLTSSLRQLQHDEEHVRLKVDVRDRVYIAETDAVMEGAIPHEEPSTSELLHIINTPLGTRYHFVEACVSSHGGELVTTVLFRVSVTGRTLSLDLFCSALTRTPERFLSVKNHVRPRTWALLAAGARGLRDLQTEIPQIWRLLELPAMLAGWLWAQKYWQIAPYWAIRTAPRVCVREKFTQEWDDVQLDKLLILDHMKIIEERLLKATKDFLDARKVDTSQFEKRMLQIINSEFANIGGNAQFVNSSVGRGSQTNNSVQLQNTASENG